MTETYVAQTLFEADKAMRENRWTEAITLYDEVLQAAPNHQVAQQGRRRAEARQHKDEEVRELIQTGDEQMAAGHYRQAAETYTRAINLGGQEGILKYHALLEGRRNQARDLDVWQTRLQKAQQSSKGLESAEAWEKARELFDSLIHEMPDSPPYAAMLKQARQERERIEGQMDFQALFERAVRALEADDYEQAMELASAVPDGTSVSKRARKLSAEARHVFETSIQPILQRAETAYQEGRWADAAAELDQLRESFPGNPSWQRPWLKVWMTHGQQELDRGRQANTARRFEEAGQAFEKAQQAFDKVLETHPTHATAPRLLAEAEDLHLIALEEIQAQGDWQAERRKEARAALEGALERIRRAREAKRDYAAVAATVEAMHQALLTELERIVEEERHLKYGELRLGERRLGEAADYFRETLSSLLSEHQRQAADGLSRAEAEQRAFQADVERGQAASNLDSAVAAFQAAYDRWPYGPDMPRLLEETLVEAGEAALNANQDRKAAGYFERALKLNEDNKRAQRGLEKVKIGPLVQKTLDEIKDGLSELQKRPEVRSEDFDPLLKKLDQVLRKARNFPDLATQLESAQEEVHQQQMPWKEYARLADQAERRRQARDWEAALEKLEEAVASLGDWPATGSRERLAAWGKAATVLQAARQTVPKAYQQAQEAYEAATETSNFAVALVPLDQAEEALRQAQEATGNLLPPDLEPLTGQVADLRQRTEVASQAMSQYAAGNLADAVRTLRAATALRSEDPVLSTLRSRLEEEFKTHADEVSAELLRRADAAIEDGNLTEALDLLRQARELRPTPEIQSRYNQLRRRKELEDRLREAEADYQGKLATHSLPDASKALHPALKALLEPEAGLPSEVRDQLLTLEMLGGHEDGLALGKGEHWQTAQNLLEQIGRAGTEHWAARRAYYFADLWARLAREVALQGIIASSIELGNILESYRAAAARVRQHPTDEEVIDKQREVRELLISRLNDSAGKRLSRGEQAVAEGRFSVALENLKSLEGDIYEPVEAEFPGMLEQYEEVAKIWDEAARLRERAERLESLYEQVSPLLEDAEKAFLNDDLDKAEEKLREIGDVREAPDLQAEVEDMYRRITEASSEKARQTLHAALTAAEAGLMVAITTEDYQSILKDLQESQQDLDMQLLAEEDRARYTQMVKQVSQAKEAFVEGESWFEKGQAFFDQGNYEEAVGALDKALAATREGGKKVEIQVMLDKAHPLAKDQRRQQEAQQRGEALFHAADYEKARQELTQAQALGGDVGSYLNATRAGALLESAKRHEKDDVETALLDLEDVIRLDQGNSLAEGILEEARRLSQRLRNQREEWKRMQTDLNAVRLALAEERLDEAQAKIQEILQEAPDNSQAQALQDRIQCMRQARDLVQKAQTALEKGNYDEAHANVTTILESVLPGYPDAQALLKRIEAGKQANEALVRAESLARSHEFQQARQALKQAIGLKADPARLREVQDTIAELERSWEAHTIGPIHTAFRDGDYADYAEALGRCHQALGREVSPDFRVELENLQTNIVNRWTEKGLEQARRNLGQATSEEEFDSVVAILDQLVALEPAPAPSLVREINRLRRRAHEGRLQLQIQAATRLGEEEGDWKGALDWLEHAGDEAEKLGLGRIVGEVAKFRFKIEEKREREAVEEERTRGDEWLEEARQKLAAAAGRADLEGVRDLARQVLRLRSFEHDSVALDLEEEAKQAISFYDTTAQAIEQARQLLHDRRFREATSALGLTTVSSLLQEQYEQVRALSRILLQAEKAQDKENWEVALEHYQQALALEPVLEARLEGDLDRCRNRLLEAITTRAQAALEMTPPEPDTASQLLDEAEEKDWLTSAYSATFVRLRNWATSQEQVVQAVRLLEANEPAQALDVLSQARRAAPDDQRDHIQQWEHLTQAALAWEQSELDVAKRELEALEGSMADLPLARRLRDGLARARQVGSDLRRALEDADKALRVAPPRYDDAVSAMQRASELAPGDSRADRARQNVRTQLQGDVERARQANQYDDALKLARMLLRLVPDDEILVQQVKALPTERKEHLEAAIANFHDALQADQLDKARSALERARTIASPEGDPRMEPFEMRLKERSDVLKQVDALISKARSHVGRGQWEQATDSLLEARKNAPAYQPVVETTNDLLDGLGSLARTCLTEERFDDGIALCDLALRLPTRADIVTLREDISRTWDMQLATLVQLAGSALDSWDMEEAARVLQRGRTIATKHRVLPQGDKLHDRLQQMYDVAPQLKEAMEKGWSALEDRDYQAAQEVFAQALKTAPEFREAERWRDYADNMARAIRTIQEQEKFALGTRYLEAAEGFLRIRRGERLPSVLGGQTRLREERRLAVYEAYRLAQAALSMAELLDQMRLLIRTGELEQLEKAHEMGDRLQQERDAFSQLWQAQVAPPDDFSVEGPAIETRPEAEVREPESVIPPPPPEPKPPETMPPEAVEVQPKPDISPLSAYQPEETIGLAWQVAGASQAAEAQESVPLPTLREEPTKAEVTESLVEPTEPPSAREPLPEPELVPEETPTEPESGTDDQPPPLSWSSMMAGYTITPLEEDEDE